VRGLRRNLPLLPAPQRSAAAPTEGQGGDRLQVALRGVDGETAPADHRI